MEDEEYEASIDENLRNRKKNSIDLSNLTNVNDYERSKILRELFSEFDILLAQRDFEKAVEMLLKIKMSTQNKQSSTSATSATAPQDDIQQLIYKQKEAELINILRKDLVHSKERGKI